MNAKELQQDPEFTSKREELVQAMRVLDAELAVWQAKQDALERRIGQQLQKWADQYPEVTIRLDTNYRFTVTDVVQDLVDEDAAVHSALVDAVMILETLAKDASCSTGSMEMMSRIQAMLPRLQHAAKLEAP